MIANDITTTNEAWARRSAELLNLIASSTGATKEAYQRMYEDESAAYEQSMSDLQADLLAANQALLDAQDKSADDFVAAQEEVGRREQEALNGVFAILRQVLGPDADIIISMIQNTYNRRREAYLAEGQATAEAAGRANLSELQQLDTIFAQLRALLGPDADVIISLIKGTYQKRQEAYTSGGTAAANAAETSAASERTSVANINQLLRDLFGPEAQGIIDQILALYNKRAKAYQEGGQQAGAAAEAGAQTERQSIANINQLLRNIFGPEAQEIIDQILALYNKRATAHREGGAAAAGATTEATNAETGALETQGGAVAGSAESAQTKAVGAINSLNEGMLSAITAGAGKIPPSVTGTAQAAASAWVNGGLTQAGGITSGFGAVSGALGKGYDIVLAAQGQGSNRFTAGIQAAQNAEDAWFKAVSQVLLQRISTSKGAERDALIEQYNMLQREHDAKSRAI